MTGYFATSTAPFSETSKFTVITSTKVRTAGGYWSCTETNAPVSRRASPGSLNWDACHTTPWQAAKLLSNQLSGHLSCARQSLRQADCFEGGCGASGTHAGC